MAFGGAAAGMGDFEPLWLDPRGRCLYAALHRGAPARASVGVVLVPPLLHELATSRRFVTEAAAGLAAQGVPSLRFDFYGTGDSGGRGDELDFASMYIDLALAVAALREQARVERVALLVWRGAALLLGGWLKQGGHADMVVLWEPITDGHSWLVELECTDASERAERPGYRPGVPCTTDPSDGQLMGFPLSPRLRLDLAQARFDGDSTQAVAPVWAIVRADAVPDMTAHAARILALPGGAPVFAVGAAMDQMFFVTPPIRNLMDELGQSLREQSWT